ncbi:MAG TPA: DUF3817 domain-containing protein [Fulvivirga sp.]|nr:DUF3817 domain-containing protein [Fulvivirga sp.]
MIKTLRILALLEGISTIVLFGVAMPLKYIWDFDAIMFPVGMSHGVLFLAYCLIVFIVFLQLRWKTSTLLLSWAASLIPGGTFYVDYKIFRKA